MEHNEYAVYTIEYDGEYKTGKSIDVSGEVEITNHGYRRLTTTIIAPKDDRLALMLIDYTLRPALSIDTINIKIISKVIINHIIRFENAYRARL